MNVMEIECRCGNTSSFVLPLWCRTTFMIEESGSIKILHTKPLESLEEKLVDQGKSSFRLTCTDCGDDDVHIKFQPLGTGQEAREQKAMDAL